MESKNTNMPVGLFDFDSHKEVVKCLSKVTGRSESEINSILFREAMETGTAVTRAADDFGVTPHVYNERMACFYSETDAFVFELTVGHMRKACKKIDQRVIESVSEYSDGAHMLCLGDGIGTDSLRFAKAGFNVTYFEFEGPSSQFAERRFAREGVVEKVNVINSIGGIPHSSFDVVICREVLEHVPKPKQVIKDIRKYANKKGICVITESFSRIEDKFPTHIASNEKYAGKTKKLFVEEGFELLRAYDNDRPIVLRKTKKSDKSRFSTLPKENSIHVKSVIRRVGKKVLNSFP